MRVRDDGTTLDDIMVKSANKLAYMYHVHVCIYMYIDVSSLGPM